MGGTYLSLHRTMTLGMIMNKTVKQHGNTGNKNASKDKDVFLHIRLTQEQKNKMVHAAVNAKMTLTDWVLTQTKVI